MRHFIGIFCLLLLAGASLAFATGSAIGRVKESRGQASILRDGNSQAASVGQEVFEGDVLKTGRNGALGVTFVDRSRLSIGPDSRLQVDEYVYSPDSDEGSFVTRLTRGTLLYVSGLIAKLKPESAAVHTPVGTIGIRGTRFRVKLAKDKG